MVPVLVHHISYLIYYNLLLHLLDQQWNGRTNKEIGHSPNFQGVSSFLQAFTLFATHFLELCQLESLYPNVENQHMQIQHTRSGDTGAESVVYTYLLNRGSSEERHYGTESVKSNNSPVGNVHGISHRACFCFSRTESSRNDSPSFKRNSRGKDNCFKS